MNENYFEKLVKVCVTRGFSIDGDMHTVNGKFVLYKIILNPQSRHGTVCISAGIHGNEVSGPWAILEFLKKYRPQPRDPRIILLPVLNPHGFLKNQRRDYKNSNLNRNFLKHPQSGDTRKIASLVRGEKIDYFISLHEDDDQNGFYQYQYGTQNPPATIINRFLIAKKLICKARDFYGELAQNGVVPSPKTDGSFEEWMWRRGIPSVCLEAPDTVSFAKRVKIVSHLLELVVKSSQKAGPEFKLDFPKSGE